MRAPVPTARQKAELAALVRARRIESVPVDLARAEGFLRQAEDALADVPNLTRPQNAYNLAYDAAHDVGEAMLAAFGYRTAWGRGQHEALGRFLVAIFDTPPANRAANRFEQLRRERNQQRYDARPVGEAGARTAQVTAQSLVDAALSLTAGAEQTDQA